MYGLSLLLLLIPSEASEVSTPERYPSAVTLTLVLPLVCSIEAGHSPPLDHPAAISAYLRLSMLPVIRLSDLSKGGHGIFNS